MATILKNWYDVISLPCVDRFGWNLVRRCQMPCPRQWIGLNGNRKYNSNMADVRRYYYAAQWHFGNVLHKCCFRSASLRMLSVASLRLVSPGAATDGCHPIFPQKNWRPFKSPPLQSDDLFSCRLLTTPGDTLQFIFVAEFRKKTLNSATKNNWRVSPTAGCHSRRSAHLPPPLLVTPLYVVLKRHCKLLSVFTVAAFSEQVASWCCGRVSDSRSRGRGFESRPGTTA